MIEQHFRIGPSKAKQWMHCTASISYTEANRHKLPKSNSSVYSEEGTEAHEWGAKVLTGTVDIEAVPDNFRPFIRTYANSCLSLKTEESLVYVERKVPLFYAPDKIGTVDWLVATPHRIDTRDYKHGQGVWVPSHFNPQLAIYTYSAIVDLIDAGVFDWPLNTPISIHAIQPRHRMWVDEPWETTLGELTEFCTNEILPAAQRILEERDLVFAPSEGDTGSCRFCEMRYICTARAEALNTLPTEINPLEHFTDLSAPDMETLSEQQLLAIYEYGDRITKFVKDVEKYLFGLAMSGKALNGTKLVMGRQGNRTWSDTNQADAALAALGLSMQERYEQSLKSITTMEKLLKDKQIAADLNSLAYRPPGKPTLALDTDKRPAITSPVDGFVNLESASSNSDEE